MKTPIPRSTRNSGANDWISAIGTLLVLSGIYASMDNFASYADTTPQAPITEKSLSVAPPYWNEKLSYGFRSVAGDTYHSTGTLSRDTVSVQDHASIHTTDTVKVSYYRDTPIDIIDKSLPPDTPRAYARLTSGIAVIEGDLDSPRAKTIFASLHSD